jgi:pilus assembly protein Flp/PilA
MIDGRPRHLPSAIASLIKRSSSQPLAVGFGNALLYRTARTAPYRRQSIARQPLDYCDTQNLKLNLHEFLDLYSNNRPFCAGAFTFLKVGTAILRQSASDGDIQMFATVKKLLANEDGATAIEYGLIAALIAVAAVTVMGTVGTNLSTTFNTIAGKL